MKPHDFIQMMEERDRSRSSSPNDDRGRKTRQSDSNRGSNGDSNRQSDENSRLTSALLGGNGLGAMGSGMGSGNAMGSGSAMEGSSLAGKAGDTFGSAKTGSALAGKAGNNFGAQKEQFNTPTGQKTFSKKTLEDAYDDITAGAASAFGKSGLADSGLVKVS
jgi:hypothetical protein